MARAARTQPLSAVTTLVASAGSDGYALADPAGSEVLVYLPEAAPFELTLPGAVATKWDVEWFDPRTGQKASGKRRSSCCAA